jgi:hypothetical protein
MRRIVDEDIDTTKFGHGGVYDLAAVGGFLNVARHQDDLSTRLLDQPLYLLRILIFAQTGDQQVRPLPGEGQRDRSADAAVATGMMARLPVKRPDPLYDASPWSGIGSMRAVDPGIGCCCLGNGGFGGPGIPVSLV